MSVPKDFLLSVHERCNKHLKEQPTERNQAITFYLIIISFCFGSYSATNKLLVSPYSPVFFNVVICLINGMTIRTLSGLRSWYMQYTNSTLALNKVALKSISRLDALSLGIRPFFDKKKKEYHGMLLAKMFSGIKNRVIPGVTLISGFSVAMLVKEVMSLLKVSSKEIIVLVECTLYLAYTVYYFYDTIMVIRESANHRTWVVDFG